MLIANRTSRTTVVDLPYYRRDLVSGETEKDTQRVSVDAGPGFMTRAYQALYQAIDGWNRRGQGRWQYWSA